LVPRSKKRIIVAGLEEKFLNASVERRIYDLASGVGFARLRSVLYKLPPSASIHVAKKSFGNPHPILEPGI
jgi:hypothetical protein